MLIKTHELIENSVMEDNSRLQVYCGLDCMVTLEVFEELCSIPNPQPDTYNYERALQGPLLEVMLRGFAIDEVERQAHIKMLASQIDRVNNILQRLAFAIWDKGLNANSWDQCKAFFYSAMKLPEVVIYQKGIRKVSINREALEKLHDYFYARPIINCILLIRDLRKQKSTLETEIDSDGRMRTSYNIAGTETYRLSSSVGALGTGSNLQNISPNLRRIFIADPGWKLCVIDLEQAESRELGWLLGTLFNDWSYLDACEGGDLHTTTAKLIWKNLPWSGTPKGDRLIADRIFYRNFSYRDMAKRGSHGTNYYGTPATMARHLKVPRKLIQDFQQVYLNDAFPGIPRYHRWCANEVQTIQKITTPFGQTRHFYGRPNDDATLREAIAFSPQSSTAIRTNIGLYRIWDRLRTRVQLLAQTHDSITFQYKESDNEKEIIETALSLMRIELRHGNRTFVIPGEAKIGWNWQGFHPKKDECKQEAKHNCVYNPDGLKKWNPKEPDTRKRTTELERVFS